MSSNQKGSKRAGKKGESSSKNRTRPDDKPPVEQPTPIIITGGSLTLESQLVDLTDWLRISPTKMSHPFSNRKITRILIQDDNNPATLPTVVNAPANGKCTITIEFPPIP
jgi:hypothetical protein